MSPDLVGTVRREDYDGGYSIWLRARTTAAGEHWVCIHASSSAPGNPGMEWAGWDPIEDCTVIVGAVPGTPAAEVPTDDVTALGVAVYVPTLVRTAVQEATVAALDSLSSLTRLVDAVPVDSVADEPCGSDRAHGAATVYGGPCGGLCLPCAVVAVRAAPWDATDPAVVSLDVLRHPAVTR